METTQTTETAPETIKFTKLGYGSYTAVVRDGCTYLTTRHAGGWGVFIPAPKGETGDIVCGNGDKPWNLVQGGLTNRKAARAYLAAL